MKINRNINGLDYEIELTQREMNLAYDAVRKEKWEKCVRRQVDLNAENLRFNESFGKEDFIDDCMLEFEEKYYKDDYDIIAEEIVFSQAELNDLWEDGENE